MNNIKLKNIKKIKDDGKKNIFVSFDNLYFKYFLFFLYSFIKSTKNITEWKINIIALETKLDKEKIVNLKIKFSEVNINTIWISENLLQETYYNQRYSINTNARLLVPLFCDSSIKKVLWLDVDIYINKDLTNLFEHNPEYIAAVLDINFFENTYQKFDLLYKKYGLYINAKKKTIHHINAGVLIMNISNLQKDNFVKKALIASKNIKFPLLDQDVINYLYKNKIDIIDIQYNYQLYKRHFTFIKNKAIVHFNGDNPDEYFFSFFSFKVFYLWKKFKKYMKKINW